MLALLALGVLHRTGAFPEGDVSPDTVRELLQLDIEEHGHLLAPMYEELIPPLRDKRRDDLALAVKDK